MIRTYTRIPPLLALLTLLVVWSAAVGCDVIEPQSDVQRLAGDYAAEAAPDSLTLTFTPHTAYDEQNESPFLPDTSLDLLAMGGRFEFTLGPIDRFSNQGSAEGQLVIPDSVFLDRDSLFYLVPDTAVSFEGDYVVVVDRVLFEQSSELQPADPSGTGEEAWTAPLPTEWRLRQGGVLRGSTSQGVTRPITEFDPRLGREETVDRRVGTLTLRVVVSR